MKINLKKRETGKVEQIKLPEIKTNEKFRDALLPVSQDAYREMVRLMIESPDTCPPIVLDHELVLLDGHHRVKAATEAGLLTLPGVKLEGVSDEAKLEEVYQRNLSGRHGSPEQLREYSAGRLENLLSLYQADPEKWPIKEIAARVGKSEKTIRNRMKNEGLDAPDLRFTLTAEDRQAIELRIQKEDCKRQIAADFGITAGRVSQIAKEKKSSKRGKPKHKVTQATIVDTGPFIATWPSKRNEAQALVKRVSAVCLGGEMAIAVFPEEFREDIQAVIEKKVDGKHVENRADEIDLEEEWPDETGDQRAEFEDVETEELEAYREVFDEYLE